MPTLEGGDNSRAEFLKQLEEIARRTISAFKKITETMKQVQGADTESGLDGFVEAHSGDESAGKDAPDSWETQVWEGRTKFSISLSIASFSPDRMKFGFEVSSYTGDSDNEDALLFGIGFQGRENEWWVHCSPVGGKNKEEKIRSGIKKVYSLPEVTEIVEEYDIEVERGKVITEARALQIIEAFSKLFKEKFEKNKKRSI